MIRTYQEICSSSNNPMQYSMVFGSCDGEDGEGSTSAINCVKFSAVITSIQYSMVFRLLRWRKLDFCWKRNCTITCC